MLILGLIGLSAALYSPSDAVIEGTAANFKKLLKTELPVLVEFFAPWCGHCKNLAPEFKKAAKQLKGAAKLIAVDCDAEANKPLCGQYDIKGFPTLKTFGSGVKGMPSDYNGAREAAAIKSHMLGLLTARSIVSVGGTSKKALTLEEFKSSSEGKLAKVLFLNDKSAVPVFYKAVANEFKDRLVFGEVKPAQKEIREKLVNGSTASVIVFAASDPETEIVYHGDLKIAPLTAFLKEYATPSKEDANEKPKKKEAPAPPREPFDPLVPEISSQEDFEAKCGNGQAGVCVLTFVLIEPDFPESKAQVDAVVATLSKIKKTFYDKASPFHFYIIDTAKHGSNVLEKLGVSDMFPSMTAVNAKRHVYRNHVGAFDKKSIGVYLTEMMEGRGRSFSLKTVPTLDKPQDKADL